MSQSIFQEIKETMEEVMTGRKYLISTIEKLRKTMPDLGPSIATLDESIKGLSQYANIAQSTQARLDGMQGAINSVDNMAVAMESLRKSLQETENTNLTTLSVLEAIKKSNDRQEQAIGNLGEMLGQLGELLGSILSKLQ